MIWAAGRCVSSCSNHANLPDCQSCTHSSFGSFICSCSKMSLNGEGFQKLAGHFGEHLVNFETIWSGFARATGIGCVCAGWGAGQYTDLGEKWGKGGNVSEAALKMSSYKIWENYLRGGEEEKAMWPFQRKRKLWIDAEKTNGKVIRLTMNNRAAKKGNCVLPFLRKPFLLATNHPSQRLESY